MSSPTTRSATNPFVGPRSFGRGDQLHGRRRETQDLFDLLVAERVVLLHSPSGAGKTSLIQAGLVPRLEDDGFDVLPLVRLTNEGPAGWSGAGPAPNRYVRSALLCLEEGTPVQLQRPLEHLAGLSLAEYLAHRRPPGDRPENTVLVVDQLEEIITADPVDRAAKTVFFEQLGAALRDRGLWALLAMREDFLAELDPYVRLVPTRLATRYRLDLLSVDAALEAMTLPARDAGVEFEPEAARRMVDDLRRIRVQRPDGAVDELGPYVEPVQLQVVCRRLWDRLDPAARSIGLADVESVGDVDQALGQYYRDSVSRAAWEAGVSERIVRDWLERDLVTPQGFRGQAMQGPSGPGSGTEGVLPALTAAHLLRAETRRGATWYELAHDRLVAPLQQDNARWRVEHLSDFERRATWWDDEGRPDHLLLAEVELAAIDDGPGARDDELAERERDFLAASRRARALAERERQANRRTRRWLAVAVVGCVLALAGLGAAVWSLASANAAGARAARAGLIQSAAQRLGDDADLGLLLALRAATLAENSGAPTADVAAIVQNALTTIPVVQVLRDGGPVTAAVYSDDGRLVVTGNGDGTVLVRDSSTGVTVRALSVPDAVRDVAAGSGGAVAAAQEGGAVAVWGPDGSTATVVEAHRNGDALAVAFRPDGTAVASGGADGSMAVTDTRTGRVEWVLRRPDTSSQPPPAVNDLDWTSDGRFVITADDAGVLAVWDTGTGELVREVSGHAGRATAVDALGDGSRLLSGGIDGVATLRDTATGAEIARVDAQVPVADVSASPDGNRLLIVDIAGNARVVDGRAGRVLRTVVGRGASPLTADFDPTAPDRAVIATRGGAPAIWDVAAGHPNRNPPTTLDMAGDGTTVSAAPDDDAVRLWSPEGRERGSVATGTGGVPAAALTADGQLLVVVDKTGRASLQRLGRPGSPTPLNTAGVTAVAGGPGRRVATSSGSSLTIWDGDSGIPLRVLGPSGGNVRAVAFGPTPDQLISASADGTATVWGADGRPRHVLQLDGVPTTVAWSPGDDTVATAGDDGVVQLWNAGTGQLRSVLRGHRERVNDVAFDATGSRVATVGDDGEVNLWDVRTGDLLTRRPQPTWIYRVRFTPDGRNLLVTSARGNPYLVYLDDRELLDTARARTTRVLTRDECNRFVQPFASCDQE